MDDTIDFRQIARCELPCGSDTIRTHLFGSFCAGDNAADLRPGSYPREGEFQEGMRARLGEIDEGFDAVEILRRENFRPE